jgi:hypothetical protein
MTEAEEHKMHRGYTAGCWECQQKAKAKVTRSRDRYKRSRELRDDRMVSVHPKCTHGTYGGYIVYSCRCRPCTDARAAYQRELRADKKQEAETSVDTEAAPS